MLIGRLDFRFSDALPEKWGVGGGGGVGGLARAMRNFINLANAPPKRRADPQKLGRNSDMAAL